MTELSDEAQHLLSPVQVRVDALNTAVQTLNDLAKKGPLYEVVKNAQSDAVDAFAVLAKTPPTDTDEITKCQIIVQAYVRLVESINKTLEAGKHAVKEADGEEAMEFAEYMFIDEDDAED